MKRNMLISAVLVISFVAVSIANANLFLTIDGENPTGIPLMLTGTGPYTIVLDGNTPIGPNDVRFVVITGTLTAIPDTNNQYTFEYEGESTMGLIRLITNIDITIDGFLAPAGMTIYELFVFCNPEHNFTGACGSDITVFIPPPEEEQGEQGETIIEEPPDSSVTNEEPVMPDVEKSQGQAELQSQYDYNSLPSLIVRQEERVFRNCPNMNYEIIPYNPNREETESITQSGKGGEELTLDGVIEISSDITTNQIWTANNTYHITADINIQALLIIEPGTTVKFSSTGSMYINNGGTLISCGMPDNPIIYTSDSAMPDFSDYYCPIYIEETASSSTKVTYSYIEYSHIGIFVNNNRLDSPIENNYFYYNTYGLVEVGTKLTDIQNNLIYFSDYGAIDVNLASETGQGNAVSNILIQNNTCDYWQSVGITVRGVENPDDAGMVELSNNIVSQSYYYGIALVNGYMYFTVTNTGYFGNTEDKYWEFEEYNPVYETGMPYIEGTHYLRQECNFINAGYEYIERTRLIGKTTDVNSFPDSNYTDIGFHYPNWDFSNSGDGNILTIDLNADMKIDFKDFAVLADGWQITYGIDDLNTLADEWLKIGSEPNIQVQFNGDFNNGYVAIDVNGYTSDTIRIFLLANGKYIREIFSFISGDTQTIDISELGDDVQQFKIVSINHNGHITCSNIMNFAFSRPLVYSFMPQTYKKNKPLYFAANNSSGGNITVNVYANGGNPVWSQSYSGNSILGSIPETITGQYDLDYTSFNNSSGQSLAKKIAVEDEDRPIRDVQALLITPDVGIGFADQRIRAEVKKALKNKGVVYHELWTECATYKNVLAYAKYGKVKYMFIDAQGDYLLPRYIDNYWMRRTNIKLYDGTVVSMKRSDFVNPNNAPPWCEDLLYWERYSKSFFSMGFTRLEFVYSFACYGGRLKINSSDQLIEGQRGEVYDFDAPHSDMSIALGMGDTSRSRVYQGWYDRVPVGSYFWENEYPKWTRLEWQYLGEGESLYWALYYVIEQQTEFGPEDPVNNYILRGQGSWMDIELRNW